MSKQQRMVIRQLYLVTMQTVSIMGCYYTEKYAKAQLQWWEKNKCKLLSEDLLFQCVWLWNVKCEMPFLQGRPDGEETDASTCLSFTSSIYFIQVFFLLFMNGNYVKWTHGGIPYRLFSNCFVFTGQKRLCMSSVIIYTVNQMELKSLIYLGSCASGKTIKLGEVKTVSFTLKAKTNLLFIVMWNADLVVQWEM